MPNYVVPQVQVFQEFQTAAAAVTVQLPAFIFGPNYKLFRYADAEEKAQSLIGDYDFSSGNTAVWPNRPAGSVVDQSWTRVFFDSAWLRYYDELAGGATEIKGYVDPDTSRMYRNRIRCDQLTFATYGTWARSAVFNDRDVQPGDGIILHATVLGEEITFTSIVNRLVNDTLASVIDSPVADTNNAPTTVAGITETVVSGSLTDISTAEGGTYDGIADGKTSESYILTVTTAGGFGTARFSVVSASGTDTPASALVPLDGVAVNVGSRGLQITFTSTGSDPVFEDGYVLRLDVQQDWTPAVASDSGTYVGTSDGTYMIQVNKGGLWADNPQVFVTSTGTLDSSGPYVVASATDITLPTGVKFQFAGDGLVKGDRYYIDVTASKPGAIHMLELRNSLPLEFFQVFSDSDTPNPVNLDCSLSIVKNIEVLRTRSGIIPNWTTSATQIEVEPGILAKDSSWTDSLGNMLDLDVIKGFIYVQYRSLLNTYVSTFGSCSDVGEVESLLGPSVEDNPLSLGVLKAVQNSGGQPVGFMATAGGEDDLSAYTDVLEKIYDREDVYGLVPLTHSKTILDAVYGHCLTASSADRGRWRVMWCAAQITEQSAVLQTDESGNMLLCTIVDDPDTSGSQYTYLNCDDANFITSGVVAGETVRVGYYVNPQTGEEVYDEYVIDSVISEEYLRLATGPDAPITVPSRFEVWKDNTPDDMVTQVTTLAGSYNSRRVRVVMPDRAGDGGTFVDGMFVCCALSGLRSGVWPHQGLTNVTVVGFDDMSRLNLFGGRQLNDMAAAGVWIVTQDNTGLVFTRHQLTTDMTDVNSREDSMVANIDALSYFYLRFFRNARYIGRRNITPGLLAQLSTDFDGISASIISSTANTVLGPQILSATLVSLERHPTLLDKLVAVVNLDLPEPFNNFDLTLFVLAQ